MTIHEAASKGNKEVILHELNNGVPVDARDEENMTPLMFAVSSPESNAETVQLLLDRGADLNAVGGEYARAVLGHARRLYDPIRVQCLLDAGVDIAEEYSDEFDALMGVPSERFRGNDERLLPLVEYLLKRGASVSRVSEDGLIALNYAFDSGNFRVVKRLLEAGADESHLGWTPLMRAVVLGTVDEVRELLNQGASLTDREEGGERTPWLLAVDFGNLEKAKLLLEAGANINDMGWYERTTLFYPIEANNPEMLKWLLDTGCDVEATGEYGKTPLMQAAEQDSLSFVQMLLEAGANPHKTDKCRRKAIDHTSSLQIVRLLLAYEESLDDLRPEVRSKLFGIGHKDTFALTREDVQSGWNPRFGTSNPEKMDVPLWRARVRSGASDKARRKFYPSSYEGVEVTPPAWSYPRFEMSLTELLDGRFVEIGGYYEQPGDDDFYIFNDVLVHNSNRTTDIYGYPVEVFPPTDGHSATLVGDFIYIIGCIGYVQERIAGYTPIYRLNVNTFAIENVVTTGENPGWIFNHKAVLVGNEIHISNFEEWTGPDEKPSELEQIIAQFHMGNETAKEEANKAVLEYFLREPPKSPERFILNLDSLTWRRSSD